MKSWQTILLATLYCLLSVPAYPPVGLWPLAFVALVPLGWIGVAGRQQWGTLGIVIAAAFLMWLWMHQWILTNDVTTPGWLALGLVMAVYPAFFVWIIGRVRASNKSVQLALPMIVLVPVVWVGLECLRGRVVGNGYPWFLLGHPLVEWPAFAQSADLFGTYFISFLAAMTAGGIVDLLRLWKKQGSRRIIWISVSTAGVVLIGNLTYGYWRLSQTEANLSPGPRVLAIQTNLKTDNKQNWSPPEQERDVVAFINQTRQSFADATHEGKQVDLIIWPETMLPGFGLTPETFAVYDSLREMHYSVLAAAMIELSDQLETPILLGTAATTNLHVEGNQWLWDDRYNSAYLIVDDPPYQRYDKVFLTPFGETMPYISNWQWLEEKLLALGAKGMSFGLSAGHEIRRLRLETPEGAIVIGTPICFEDTVGWLSRDLIYDENDKIGDILINMSNDGWFGTYDGARIQHAQIARFRCIENRVPLVRSVNTGLSIGFDSCGRIIGQIGAGTYGRGQQAGALVVSPGLDSRETVYSVLGDMWAWMMLILTTGCLGATFVPRFFSKKAQQ